MSLNGSGAAGTRGDGRSQRDRRDEAVRGCLRCERYTQAWGVEACCRNRTSPSSDPAVAALTLPRARVASELTCMVGPQ